MTTATEVLDTSEMRRVPCALLGTRVSVPARPMRVVSLVSGWTEALYAMGLADRVVGVSSYCARYVGIGARPVVGDYLRIDEAALAALRPDLVLLTAGVQLGVARRLAAAGFPVMVLPLPESIGGIVENIRRLGGLMNEMAAAHALVERMESEIDVLRKHAPRPRPRVYAELWFGRHVRMAGGLSFVHDLIELAGGDHLGADIAEGFPKLEIAWARAASPDVVLVFWEEDDHPVDVPRLLRERGWVDAWPHRVIEAGIQRGRNLIHDGPSILETARWLQGRLHLGDAMSAPETIS